LSVAISGNTLVVGAPDERSKATGVNGDQSDNSALYAGAAYVFVRDGTNWSQQAYLKASNTDADDGFGSAVAVLDNLVLVGARNEASNATGVNGDQSDNSAPIAGAAYVFLRSTTNWSQQAYLKPSNTRTYDEFGSSLAVSGDTVVVGANGDSSNAIGVNGNQSNTNAPFSGAAYVFTGLPTPAPQLAIEQSADSVRILWPLAAANFVLDETDALNASPIGWTQVPFPYQTNATDVAVTLPLAAGNRFYRLRKP